MVVMAVATLALQRANMIIVAIFTLLMVIWLGSIVLNKVFDYVEERELRSRQRARSYKRSGDIDR